MKLPESLRHISEGRLKPVRGSFNFSPEENERLRREEAEIMARTHVDSDGAQQFIGAENG